MKPVQQPSIPVYFGGSSDAAIEVAGKHADIYALWVKLTHRWARRSAGCAIPPPGMDAIRRRSGSASRFARSGARPKTGLGSRPCDLSRPSRGLAAKSLSDHPTTSPANTGSKAAADVTLRVGDQKGGNHSLLQAPGELDRLLIGLNGANLGSPRRCSNR